MFVILTRNVLIALRAQGYTALTSISPLSDYDPVWYPQQMDIVKLMDSDSEFMCKLSVPLAEPHFLVIDDAIANIDEGDLVGQVFLESMYITAEQ